MQGTAGACSTKPVCAAGRLTGHAARTGTLQGVKEITFSLIALRAHTDLASFIPSYLDACVGHFFLTDIQASTDSGLHTEPPFCCPSVHSWGLGSVLSQWDLLKPITLSNPPLCSSGAASEVPSLGRERDLMSSHQGQFLTTHT